jgi:rhodanese-related sulfurtransferase
MGKKFALGIILVAIIGFMGYQFMMNSTAITNITTDELAEKLKSGDERVVYIDVREPDEYASGHIEGMTNIPLGTLNEETLANVHKDAEVILFCRSGNRSMQAAEKLQGLGYNKVVNVEGGITNWNGPVVK